MRYTLFNYPRSAYFGRVIHKNKIYEHAKPSTAIKTLFVNQIDQIIWQYKLSPETINLKATRAVPEIHIISIILKNGELKDDVLRCIDQAISFPVIFELVYRDKIETAAAFKRPNEAGNKSWVVGHYFKSNWIEKDDKRQALPVSLNMELLYTHLLMPLLPYPAKNGEDLKNHVLRMEQIRSIQREVDLCESQLAKEKQFNKKVELNTKLRGLKQQIDELTGAY